MLEIPTCIVIARKPSSRLKSAEEIREKTRLDIVFVSGEDARRFPTMNMTKNANPGFRPLAEMAVVFCVLYLPRSVILHPTAQSVFMPGYHLALAAGLAAGGVLLAIFMARRHGLREFFGPAARAVPNLVDVARGLAVAFVVAAAVLIPLAISILSGWTNPLEALRSRQAFDPAVMLPLVALSSLALGYSEELYFRVYAFGMLRKAGLSRNATLICSALVFAGAHAGQGAVGILSAFAAGLALQLVWIAKGEFHSIALGHAFYDFAATTLILCLSR